MEVKISNKLREYLTARGTKELTIQKLSLKACCGTPSLPSVTEGKPAEDSSFELIELEDLRVYLQRDIRVKKNTLSLDLYGFLFTKEIVVEGVEIL